MSYIIPKHNNLPWLQDRTVLYVRHGSYAYGTNVVGSDQDYKGICIPPKNYFLGQLDVFEQAECKNPDMVIYDIRKFFHLATDNNPNIIEILHTDPSDHLIVDPIGEEIIANKNIFLSKKARFTFAGYAIAQLKKINTHYKWIKNPLKIIPKRADFGLPESLTIPTDQLLVVESQINKKLDNWATNFLSGLEPDQRIAVQNKISEYLSEIQIFNDEKYQAAARSLGYSENFIHILSLEKQFSSKLKNWYSYQEWKKTRNPARAALEEKYFFDTKNAYHLVRLMRMCREILTLGKVIVKRPDREELLAIRNGAWTYEELIEWASKEDKELEELYNTTNVLPLFPDKQKIDNLCIRLVEKSLSKYSWYSVKKYIERSLK